MMDLHLVINRPENQLVYFYVIPGDFSKHGEAPFEATGHLLFLLSTIWETRLEKQLEN